MPGKNEYLNPNIISNQNKSVKTDYYETHFYDDPGFPVIFHLDKIDNQMNFIPHWHQNPELLYFTKGKATVSIDTEVLSAAAGDIVIAPSNYLHKITTDRYTEYYCLIPDLEFCKKFGIEPDSINYAHRISDENLNKKMDTIIKEFNKKDTYYKPIILSEIISLLSYAARYYTAASPVRLSKKQAARTEMIKKSFLYIDMHFSDNLTIDSLADYLGLTKYYFCHIFKQLTGMTPVSYINYIRCRKAKGLLSSGKCANVSDAAEQCGFSNLSYFTRTYKKYNGCLPSKDTQAK